MRSTIVPPATRHRATRPATVPTSVVWAALCALGDLASQVKLLTLPLVRQMGDQVSDPALIGAGNTAGACTLPNGNYSVGSVTVSLQIARLSCKFAF